MLDAGPAQPNQVDAPRAVSPEALARGGDTRSAPSAECAASNVTAAPGLQQLRSYDLRLLVSDRATYSGRPHDRRAGNGHPVASCRLSLLLALEIESACRQDRLTPRDVFKRCHSAFRSWSEPFQFDSRGISG